MNAIVSASAGRAILIDSDRFFSIESSDLATLVPRAGRDVRFLLGERRDLVFLEQVTVDDVRARLDEALRRDDALRWFLTLLDGDMKQRTRAQLAAAAESALSDGGTRDFVEGVLHARPMPRGLDSHGAERIAAKRGCSIVEGMLQGLRARSSLIEDVHLAWECIPTRLFGTHEDRERARAAVVREGLHRDLVKTIADGKPTDVIIASALMSPSIRALPHHRDFLQRWSRYLPKPEQACSTDSEEPDLEEPDLEEEGEPAGSNRRRIVGHAAWMRVEAQRVGILDALRRRNLDVARKQMTELVAFQILNGDRPFAVKSLCNLAAQAQRQGLIALQDEWTAEAVRIGPDDVRAWNQRGKALLDLDRSSEALGAYEQADLLGGTVVTKTGRAEVLKAMGRFDEALRTYDGAVQLHPDNVVARNGRAEVLKAMGRFDDALRTYDGAVQLHPDNVVARNGRAEVLKAMGRFDDALRAYDETLQLHPDNAVAGNGRAEVLKAMGRFDDALHAYDETLQLHPDNVVAGNGRATVLALQGRPKEALRALPAASAGTLSYWISQHIRGMILLRTGKVEEAIHLFEIGVRDCPFSASQPYFRTALAVARLRRRQYAAAADVLAQLTPDRPDNIAHLLHVHALGELKRFDQAAAVSKRVSPTLPDFLEMLRREVDGRYVLRTGPTWTEDELFRAEVHACLLGA